MQFNQFVQSKMRNCAVQKHEVEDIIVQFSKSILITSLRSSHCSIIISVSRRTKTDPAYYPPFASRAKGEVFGLLYVCLFVCSSTISRQPTGRFTPKFACGRSLVPDVSSPLLGFSGPRRTKKGEMKFSLLWESVENVCILAVFERYLNNAWMDHTKFYLSRDNVCRRAASHSGVHRPMGAGEGSKYSDNWGWSYLCCRQLPFLFFSALPNVVQYVSHRPAHILVQNRQRWPRRFYRVGQKVRKNFEFFTIPRLYVHKSQKLLKIEA